MQKTIFALLLATSCVNAKAQNLDELLSHPPVIELKVSNPQPRLGEEFSISYSAAYIQAQVFKPAFGRQLQENDMGDGNETDYTLKLPLKARRLGRQTVGPLSFTVNGVEFKTSAASYEVVAPLPNVTDGIWIRNVKISDTLYCIILEQRIPAEKKMEQVSPTETRYWNEAINPNEAKLYIPERMNGIREQTSFSTSSDQLVTTAGGSVPVRFIQSINYYEITDRTKKIEITKDWFLNLPASYKFENIKLQ